MNKQKLFSNVLAQDAHIQVNAILARKLGINEAIVAGELVALQHYFAMRCELTDKGYFYVQYEYLEKDTCLTYNQVVRAVKKLEEEKIISTYLDYDLEGKRIKYYKVDTLRIDDIVRNGDGSVSMNTIRSDAFIVYSKALAKRLGSTLAVIISDLYTTYLYTAEINNFVDGEWFCMVQDKQAKKLGISRQILGKKDGYIDQLVNAGLINKKAQGIKNKTHIKINFDTLYEMLGYGFKTEYTNESFFIEKKDEEVIDTYSEQERVTRLLLDHVKDISGIEWSFDYSKVADIEDRLEEGYTEDELINVIDHMYKYYTEQNKLDKAFNFKNVVGQKSKVETWMNKIERDKEKEEEKLYAEKVAYAIYNKMLEISEGKIKYDINADKIDTIRKRLAEELSEEELIEHAVSRYNYLKENGYDAVKNCSFNKLFGSKCFDDIQTVRNIKLKESASSSYDPKTKKFKMQNPEERSGLSINMKNDLRGKIDQADITGVQGQDYF